MLPILATKLYQPAPPSHFVERPSLLEKLSNSEVKKLTLVTAPAGYGKTTLVASWLKQRESCWLTLDEYDNDLHRFLRYFLAAWQGIDETIGAGAAALLQESWAGPGQIVAESIFISLINELAQRQRPFLLVLDDWHLIESQPVLKAVQYWIEHVPPHVHTVIISRTVPDFPLSRWRVRGQLTEITAPELQFTPEETALFFKEGMKLDLTAAHIQQLNQKTEGWIASLQLAAFSLQNSDDPDTMVEAFTGSNRYVVDYLAEEVFSYQEEPYQTFLLETAVLSRFDAELCDQVREAADSQQILANLDQRNLFIIPLDTNRQWFRYHPLFADYLRTQIQTEQPAHFQELNRRAFNTLMNRGFVEEAIEHGIIARQFDTVAQLLTERAFMSIWQLNQAEAFYDWCLKLPQDVLLNQPKLAAGFGWTHLFTGRRQELKQFLTDIAQKIRPHVMDPEIKSELIAIEAELALHQGDLKTVLAQLAQIEFDRLPNDVTKALMFQVQGYAHRIDGSVVQAEQALAMAKTMTKDTANVALWLFAASDLTEAYLIQGKLDQAEQVIQEMLDTVPRANHFLYPPIHMAEINYGTLLLQRNEIGAASEHVQRGLTLSEKIGSSSNLRRFGLQAMAFIQQAQGNWPKAQALMDELETFAAKINNRRIYQQCEAGRASLALIQGEIGLVEGWAASFNQEQPPFIPRLQHHEARVIYGRYLLRSQAPNHINWLQACAQDAQANHWGQSLLELHILLAEAYHLANDNQAALAELTKALQLAAPQGIIRPFIDAGQPMITLLRLALQQGVDHPYIGRLQAAFLPKVGVESLIDPLTQREIEILTLIAEGLSNPEIADRLIVATGTVARHSNNIFSKLGVRNRTEATVRARALGLV